MLAIAIHGGAGSLPRTEMQPAAEAQYRADLALALDAGYDALAQGHSSLDAVVAAVKVLEDSPLFNAGRGAVFTHDGINELDAAIMDGASLKAGAVAGLRHVRNPIELARLVMDKSAHVMMIGDGAEEFALRTGRRAGAAGLFSYGPALGSARDGPAMATGRPPRASIISARSVPLRSTPRGISPPPLRPVA